MSESSFEQELARSGRLFYTNVGVSMMPLLREGRDVMLIERRDSFHKYDAVLFRRPGVHGRGEYVLHRILRRERDGRFWIVGDNCTSGELVRPENIMGTLTAVRRGKRTVRVTDFGYRVYVALWCAPWPLRFPVLRVVHFLRRAAGFVKRRLLK